MSAYSILEKILSPFDVKALTSDQLVELAFGLVDEVVDLVARLPVRLEGAKDLGLLLDPLAYGFVLHRFFPNPRRTRTTVLPKSTMKMAARTNHSTATLPI